MAFINPDDHVSSVGHIAPESIENTTTAQNIVISPMGLTEVPLPGGGFVTNAVMTQEGGDLILESPDGITLVIEGYFTGDTPPNLVSDGKVLTPALVKSFIQASTDYAEEPVAMNDVTPVGQVQEVSGMATVTHENGTKETIVKGTAIYEGDVVETDAKGAVNIEFVDESSFAVSNNAKMAIDEFVFDAKTQGGENNFSVLRGLFVYTSGLVGREDPDDVKIETPVGSIGIRGTIITGSIPPEGSLEVAKISVVEGAIVIHAHNGTDLTLSQPFETAQIDQTGTMTNIGVLPQTDMIQTFNVLRTVAPTLFSAMEEAQQEGEAAPAEQAAPTDVPEVKEATPTEEAPAQETAPAEPEPLPDVIHLNLLPGALDPVSLDKGIASQDSALQTQATIAVAGLSLPTFMSGASAAPMTTVAAPVDTTATTPATETEGLPTGAGGPINGAPTAYQTTHNFLEQSGFQGQTYSFQVNYFFTDPDGDNLTYAITPIYNPNNALSSMTVDATGLLTVVVNTTLPGAITNVAFSVTASDGTLTSTATQFIIDVVQAQPNGLTVSAGDDTAIYILTAGTSINTLGGNDGITFNSDGSIAFGGAGEDSFLFLTGADNNYAYGDEGGDTINLINSTGNLVSGGSGNDTINIDISNATFTYQAFGGQDNDEININTAGALATLGTGASLIDGGSGFDTLALGNGLSIDLTTISSSRIMGVERIKAHEGSSSTITLDITDIVGHVNNPGELFIDTDGDDTIIVHNNIALGQLVQTGATATDASGNSYNAYSNGSYTLYISTDTNMANVSGAGIVV